MKNYKISGVAVAVAALCLVSYTSKKIAKFTEKTHDMNSVIIERGDLTSNFFFEGHSVAVADVLNHCIPVAASGDFIITRMSEGLNTSVVPFDRTGILVNVINSRDLVDSDVVQVKLDADSQQCEYSGLKFDGSLCDVEIVVNDSKADINEVKVMIANAAPKMADQLRILLESEGEVELGSKVVPVTFEVGKFSKNMIVEFTGCEIVVFFALEGGRIGRSRLAVFENGKIKYTL